MAQVRTVPSLEIARLVGDRVLAPIEFRDPLTALPGGLFRLNPAGTLYTIERNTAIAGDFSTYTTPLAISATDQIGFNIASPQDAFHFGVNGTMGSGILVERVTDDNGPAMLTTWKARGTFSGGKTVVANGDPLFKIQVLGYDGATYQPSAEISVEVVGIPSALNMGGNIVMSTTTAGTVIVTERLRIDEGGRTRISDTGTGTPDSSALLDLVSTTKGFLPTRMTTGQRDLIGSPANGLLIDNTTTGQLERYNGVSWGSVGVTDHGALTGLSDDDHTQYALLAGRVGGQTLYGGTAASETLTIYSTSHATKGKLLFGTSAYDEVNNRLGIGTASPATNCHQVGTTLVGYRADRYSADVTAPGFQAYKSRGTVGVPVIVNSGDQLISIEAYGYDGATFQNAGYVRIEADGVTGAGDMPGRLIVGLTLDGTSSATERLRINNAGNVSIGNNPGFGTSAAIVLSHALGTAPSTSPANAYQQWADDITAGNTAPHFRTEAGNVIKLFSSAAYTPTNVTADRSYDANATTIDELADIVGTLVSDLQATGLIG